MTQIPRPEHPQPQMKREHWKNLNGEWDFSFDFGCSGIDQKWQEGKTDWEKKILVPFCPESDLYPRRMVSPHHHIDRGGTEGRSSLTLRRSGL